MSRSDEYVTIEVTFRRRSEKAVFLEANGNEGWVPRSCLHFTSDEAVNNADQGDVMTVRVMEWVATDRGFV